MKEVIISDKEANQRLDKFLLKFFDKAPKSFIYKMLRKKRIKYNSLKAEGHEIIKQGDSLQMYIAEETVSQLQSQGSLNELTTVSFKVLYEDRNILVVDKPAGCISQKETKDSINSLQDQILLYLWQKGEYDFESNNSFTPAICNRLDRNTSGIIIAGKSVTALQEISKGLQKGNITKEYIALVKGLLKSKATLKAFLVKNQSLNQVTVSDNEIPYSKPITTKIEPIKSTDKYTYLKVFLTTGRPHQIRAHLAHIGYPVIGDKKYGHRGTNMTFLRKYSLNHQFLHAYRIKFDNFSGDFQYLNGKVITATLPEYLKNILSTIFENFSID